MDDFLKRVQAAALPGLWSLGVRLARAGSARLDQKDETEAVYRVKAAGRAIAPSAVLYLAEGEWSCDCGSDSDPCEHVVAAAISHKEAALTQTTATSAPVGTSPWLGYRLSRTTGPSLIIERAFVHADGTERPLQGSLATLVAARRCPVDPTHEDLAIDPILARATAFSADRSRSQGLAPEAALRLLRVLAGSRDVKLDGAPITVDPRPLLPTAVIQDSAGGLELRVEAPPDVGEILDRGVALAAGQIRPIGAFALTGARLEKLPLVRTVGPKEIATLVAEVLPEIERHVAVEVRSTRLPARTKDVEPRIHFQLPEHGHTLSILPTLVYGDPPAIRIDGDEMVHLSGAVPRRNPTREREVLGALRDELSLVPGRLVHFDGQEAARFVERLQTFQKRRSAHLPERSLGGTPLLPHVSFAGERFEIEFSTEPADAGGERRSADPGQVLRAFHDGLSVVPLEGGGWAPLPADFLTRFGHILSDLLAARRPDGTLPIFAAPRLGSLLEALGEPPPPSLARLEPLIAGFSGLPRAALPEGLKADLRGYQEEGVDFLCFLRDAELGAVLADDMGLGKTLQTLCALRGKTLVVCPRSLLFNWAAEAARFRPDLRVRIHHGPKRVLDDADLTITTYAVLRMDQELLAAHGFDTVVLDEAQNIKSADSQAARAAFALSDALPPGAFRVALSGTPVENRLEELWSILRFTHPGLLGGKGDFQDRYVAPIARGDDGAAQRLRQLIKPFLLRRLKREVAADLPPRQDSVLYVELSETERALYDAIHAAKHQEVMDALRGGGSVMAALEALLRLRQAACHPALVPGQSAPSSSKLEALLEAVEKATLDTHKCIVFSQWTSLLDLVEPMLGELGVPWLRLDGTTRDRAGIVTSFQDPLGPPILLSSLKAGGTGLNLTAADHVFLLDPWWNPAAEDQAADRAHRIGQTRPVNVVRLVAKDTIEEGILTLQARKKRIADLALGEGGAAAGLTKDDLLQLLGA